jgi:hypothetical protein
MKKIVLLSDGTGNAAASVCRTNVWRIAESLERDKSQIVMYEPIPLPDIFPRRRDIRLRFQSRALPTGGDRRSVLKPHRDRLVELRRKENDLTLDAIAERLLRAHGVEADKSILSRFFAAEGISF